MSPIVGLLVALAAGWLASTPRVAAAVAIPPMLAATAAQSWYLGTGRGHNPARVTTGSPAYWIVQVIIIGVICGAAAGVCWLRVRRAAGQRPAVASGPQRAVLLTAATVAVFALTLGAMFVTDRPSHPGSGNGNIPIGGALAVVVGLVALLVLSVDWVRRTRRLNRPQRELAH